MSFTYEFARPALTVDCVVFGVDEDDLKVMLIQRGVNPFKGKWAIPGGFVRVDESLESAARRELEEETGIRDVFLEQLCTFGDVERDPRERVVSVAYFALTNLIGHNVDARSDASNAAWFALGDLPELPFDHAAILDAAIERLRGKLRYQPIGFELLPDRFTLTQLQRVYEIVLDRDIDKRNFRKKILAMEILKDTGEVEKDVAHRAARLYGFDMRAYERMLKQGFNFEM
ncbi:MAG: NUDIX domain-containing protein [Planctomycetota bacterium]